MRQTTSYIYNSLEFLLFVQWLTESWSTSPAACGRQISAARGV
jgi:hypothetical protein